MTSNVEGYKYCQEGSHFLAFNKSYPQPKEGVLGKKAREGKTVFLAFDSGLPNYGNVTGKETLFHVNLDEEEVITKENVRMA